MAKLKKEKDKLFSDTEGKLYAYNSMKIELNAYKIDLEYLKEMYKGCKAISYENERTGETYNINNSVENEVIEKEKEIEGLEFKISRQERQIKKIENALNLLNPKEKRLVECRYFSNRSIAPSWIDIAEEIGFSEKKCRMMRNDIIEKIKKFV